MRLVDALKRTLFVAVTLDTHPANAANHFPIPRVPQRTLRLTVIFSTTNHANAVKQSIISPLRRYLEHNVRSNARRN